jgi:hypothetical protein
LFWRFRLNFRLEFSLNFDISRFCDNFIVSISFSDTDLGSISISDIGSLTITDLILVQSQHRLLLLFLLNQI